MRPATPLASREYNGPIRGVNLGGLFVLEPWITPSLFAQWANITNSPVNDEWSYCATLGKDECTRRLHSALEIVGINTIRDSDRPYIQGQIPYLKQVLGWASNYGIEVMLDLHGAPGSQNGFDNSGRRGEISWSKNTGDLARIANEFPIVKSIEALNEPANWGIPKSTLIDFYHQAYARRADGARLAPFNYRTPTIVGEFSMATTDCAGWLNGFQRGSRWDGTYLRSTPIASGGSCAGQEDIAQFQAYEKASGWVFWNFKTESSDAWNYIKLANAGIIPNPPAQHQYLSVAPAETAVPILPGGKTGKVASDIRQQPPSSSSMIYHGRKIVRGVNIGGYLPKPTDYLQLCKYLGPERTLALMKRHWDTWTDEGFVGGGLPYFKQLVYWANKYGLKGSQNGFDNSGTTQGINWTRDPNNIRLSKQAMLNMLRYISKDPVLLATVDAVDVLNEPMIDALDFSQLWEYNTGAHSLITNGLNKTPPVISIIDRGFKEDWNSYHTDTWLDAHLYHVFDRNIDDWPLERHLSLVCSNGRDLQSNATMFPIIVGEWSLALPTAALGGRENEARRRFAEAQLDAYEKGGAGWFFWCLKTESSPEWSFLDSLDRSWLPYPLTTRAFPPVDQFESGAVAIAWMLKSPKPYPKQVWSPAGGWWAQPKSWKRNTVIVGLGAAAVVAFVFKKSAELEERTIYPRVWTPSMMWSKQFKNNDDPNFQPPKSL
ncbi:glycoside hydrolase [Linderina pennispora]|uniref:glucan 1,3-beta-glucosidase n=1 Tax=Linderina pennispora TaxID=61395 RepID=A0A1Y1W3K7_9FUNG|nr:glycoside hydrolase [Linderina pennispora]ORX68047.1 glycoside hydrolase [Linderina pennispora]